jgi:hypothetical protein
LYVKTYNNSLLLETNWIPFITDVQSPRLSHWIRTNNSWGNIKCCVNLALITCTLPLNVFNDFVHALSIGLHNLQNNNVKSSFKTPFMQMIQFLMASFLFKWISLYVSEVLQQLSNYHQATVLMLVTTIGVQFLC